jgi:hypothetical protein
VLANAMKLEGAKVGGGDVLGALARTGLRLDSVNQPNDRVGAGDAAQTRLAAHVETPTAAAARPGYGVTGPGAGWWHEGEYDAEQGNDEDPGLYRKCYAGNRPPRPTELAGN